MSQAAPVLVGCDVLELSSQVIHAKRRQPTFVQLQYWKIDLVLVSPHMKLYLYPHILCAYSFSVTSVWLTLLRHTDEQTKSHLKFQVEQ